jgi:hypothetical protein
LDGRSAPSQGSYLHRTTGTQNKRRETSMSRVEFEPTIPVFERAKTVQVYLASSVSIDFICVLTEFLINIKIGPTLWPGQ